MQSLVVASLVHVGASASTPAPTLTVEAECTATSMLCPIDPAYAHVNYLVETETWGGACSFPKDTRSATASETVDVSRTDCAITLASDGTTEILHVKLQPYWGDSMGGDFVFDEKVAPDVECQCNFEKTTVQEGSVAHNKAQEATQTFTVTGENVNMTVRFMNMTDGSRNRFEILADSLLPEVKFETCSLVGSDAAETKYAIFGDYGALNSTTGGVVYVGSQVDLVIDHASTGDFNAAWSMYSIYSPTSDTIDMECTINQCATAGDACESRRLRARSLQGDGKETLNINIDGDKAGCDISGTPVNCNVAISVSTNTNTSLAEIAQDATTAATSSLADADTGSAGIVSFSAVAALFALFCQA